MELKKFRIRTRTRTPTAKIDSVSARGDRSDPPRIGIYVLSVEGNAGAVDVEASQDLIDGFV